MGRELFGLRRGTLFRFGPEDLRQRRGKAAARSHGSRLLGDANPEPSERVVPSAVILVDFEAEFARLHRDAERRRSEIHRLNDVEAPRLQDR